MSKISKYLTFLSNIVVIGKIAIKRPNMHLLDLRLKKHYLYDKFLPYLSKALDNKGIIIDIGANIGDTVIGMKQTCSNSFILIEPEDTFFKYMQKNIESQFEPDRYVMIKKMIGRMSGSLQRTMGTATLNGDASTKNNQVYLDSIVDPNSKICLIKCDIDGFDYDALLSGESIISNQQPVLFWENEISNVQQMHGYNELVSKLNQIGYNNFTLFDNYGNIMIENCDFKTIEHLNKYLFTLNSEKIDRTLYYLDIMAYTDKYTMEVILPLINIRNLSMKLAVYEIDNSFKFNKFSFNLLILNIRYRIRILSN